MFTYLAADGKTTLYGTISFPSNFDPTKKYPSLASVYGGPGSAVTSENFVDAERHERIRLPDAAGQFALGAGPRQARCSISPT